ncbi:hypothetical protein [Saccharicrinis carchari]|uniref:hypothetical protein n=1 Tax=Saccharicrinis carchari TaxID=1168039 RepID=UPI00163DAB31|nr:hypothetical protein [Saccharicrinis carchari]
MHNKIYAQRFLIMWFVHVTGNFLKIFDEDEAPIKGAPTLSNPATYFKRYYPL